MHPVEPRRRLRPTFLRGARLSRSTIASEADAREAEQHQGPRGWFGNRLDHATDDKGAKPIDRQINVRSEIGTQIDDGIIYIASGENLGAVDDNVKIGTPDHAEEQIALERKIEC